MHINGKQACVCSRSFSNQELYACDKLSATFLESHDENRTSALENMHGLVSKNDCEAISSIMGVPVCWANKASRAIFRFTVGQYWLTIKINGTNSVNFVGNSVNFVGNMLSNRNFSKSLPPPRDNNFGKFLRKIFFDNLGTIRKSRANFFPPP